MEERLRRLYAIEQIHKRLKPGDIFCTEEARDTLFASARRFGGLYRIVYPLTTRVVVTYTTIKSQAQLRRSVHETEIAELLSSPRADYKLHGRASRTTSTSTSQLH